MLAALFALVVASLVVAFSATDDGIVETAAEAGAEASAAAIVDDGDVEPGDDAAAPAAADEPEDDAEDDGVMEEADAEPAPIDPEGPASPSVDQTPPSIERQAVAAAVAETTTTTTRPPPTTTEPPATTEPPPSSEEPADSTPDDSTPDDSVPDDSTPDDSTPDDSVPDDSVPDDSVPDDSTTTTEPPPATQHPDGWVDAGHGVFVPPVLLQIRYCESTDNYTAANPSSSARGAYQFLRGSWAAYGHADRYGVSEAHLASPAQQDEAALLTWQRDGTRPWNASRHCWG